MIDYPPSSFFDSSSFAHHHLLDERVSVWEGIKKIKPYLQSLSLGLIEGSVEKGAILIHPELISIGKGSVVESGAYIVGPCFIGEHCEIRQGAYIRGNVLTGNGCVIGHATEVKNALFMDEAKAGHFAYVGDSILGNRVNLGAGTKCANLRFDGKKVSIFDREQKIDSGLRKFGAIIGDDAQTGCNSVTSPGTLMYPKSLLGPCATVSGIVPQNTIVKAPENVIVSL